MTKDSVGPSKLDEEKLELANTMLTSYSFRRYAVYERVHTFFKEANRTMATESKTVWDQLHEGFMTNVDGTLVHKFSSVDVPPSITSQTFIGFGARLSLPWDHAISLCPRTHPPIAALITAELAHLVAPELRMR